MTPEQFEQRAASCSNREELQNLRENALRAKRLDLAQLAEAHLRTRFPQRHGPTPTDAHFQRLSEHFRSGKDAYVWLVTQFERHAPGSYQRYEDLHRRTQSGGCKLARDPTQLYPVGSSRAQVESNYVEVGSSWFLDANLNHEGKFTVLLQLGYLSGLRFPDDFDFQVHGGTEELALKQAAVIKAREALQKLLELSRGVGAP